MPLSGSSYFDSSLVSIDVLDGSLTRSTPLIFEKSAEVASSTTDFCSSSEDLVRVETTVVAEDSVVDFEIMSRFIVLSRSFCLISTEAVLVISAAAIADFSCTVEY